MKNLALIVAGIVFSLVALAHLVRIFYHALIVISGHSVSIDVSYYGLIISALLAVWMFAASRSK
jgi:hypothetical protein